MGINKHKIGIITPVYVESNRKIGTVRVFMHDGGGDIYFATSIHEEEEVMFKTLLAAHEYLIDVDEKEKW